MLLKPDAHDVYTDHIMMYSVKLSTCCAVWMRLCVCNQTTLVSDPIAEGLLWVLKHRKGGVAMNSNPIVIRLVRVPYYLAKQSDVLAAKRG